jgi:RND family efflux transporter MFP subunit
MPPAKYLRCAYIFAAMIHLAACSDTPEKPEEKAVVVEAADVKGGASVITVSGTGSIEREREIVLSFRDPGIVSMLTVDNGDAVRKGQIIARQDLSQLALQASRAQAEYDKVLRDYERDKKLQAQGWISEQRLADRQTAVKAAKAALDSTNYEKRIGVLTAPSDGYVLIRHIQSGEVVSRGQPVVTMTDYRSPLVARVSLSDRDVARVRNGDPARVTVSALPGLSLAGVVSRIEQRADLRTGTTDIDVRIPAAAGLKTGFVADVQITLRQGVAAESQQRIPAEAIIEADGDRAYVMIVDSRENRARRQLVSFQGFENDDALVTGLPAGAKVITTGGALVRDGARISVVSQGAR